MNYSTALLIGRRQSGKTTYIAQSALKRIHDGAPIALFDPYGTATNLILPRIPKDRWKDVVLIEPDREHPVTFNPLYNIAEHQFSKTKDTLKHTLKSIWGYTDFPTPTMDDILNHSIGAILYSQNPTLLTLKWFLTSTKRRNLILEHNEIDIAIKDYWTSDFEDMSDRQQIDEKRSTLSKVRAFTSDPYTRNILGQYVSKINMSDILKDKILLVNVSIAALGIEASKLLGSLLMAELHQATLSHTGTFHCYIDGADRFAQSIEVEMAEMTSPVSYLFSITHLGQIEKRFKDALLGASDATLAFTTGVIDQQLLQPVYFRGQTNNTQPLLYELSPFGMCINTSYHEEPEWNKQPPLSFPTFDDASKQIRHLSRERYTRPRKVVETEITRFVRNS
jgi:hypothetical protein